MKRIITQKIAISLLICLLVLTVLGGCSSDTEEALQATANTNSYTTETTR